MPSFFRQLSVFKTSSDLNRLYPLDLPIAKDAIIAHLIDKLLSPVTSIFFLKLLILLFI